MNHAFEGLLLIIGFSSILFLAYVTTRYIAGKSTKIMKGKYINIIETVSLGIDKKLHLVKVDSQFVLIASSGKNVEFISNITLDAYENQENTVAFNTFDFKNLFDKHVQNYKNKKDGNINTKTEYVESDSNRERFKSNLNKLKTISKGTNAYGMDNGDDNTNEKN